MEFNFSSPELESSAAGSPAGIDPATAAALRFQELSSLNPDNKKILDAAFSDVFNLTYPKLRYELIGSGINEDAAVEILQTTYAKAFKALSAGKFEGRSSISTWLYRGLFNNRINYIQQEAKRRKFEQSIEDLTDFEPKDNCDIEESVIGKLSADEINGRINDIFDQLNVSEQDRSIWTERITGKSYLTIASLIGMGVLTAAAVKTRHSRLRKKVIGQLKE